MRLFEGTAFDIPPRCDRCGQLEKDCKCPPLTTPGVSPGNQTASLMVEKRKRGKVVTVVSGLVDQPDLAALLTKLKTVCGAGGTLKDGVLEIQGDHSARLGETLQLLGYKLSGRSNKK